MNQQEKDSDIPPFLWVFMALGASVAIIFLAAVLLRSLLLSIFLASLVALFGLAIWQQRRVAAFTAWLFTHPNTSAALKWSGNAAARTASVGVRIFLETIVAVGRALLWLAILPFRVVSLRTRKRSQSAIEQLPDRRAGIDESRLARWRKEPLAVTDESKLARWQNAETCEVTRPRDPRTRFCLTNIGNEIEIRYKGTKRTIRPVRVFTKTDYQKTYVDAEENGEVKTFDIDDMQLVARK